ncbi:MAG: hypothetical protein J5758_00715, partial [Abditibacteriota bacterium]|nr:hypothetical protein [Abditibacteriota bacterium]
MDERIYRIADPNKGDSMLYTLGQLEHLKNNGKITAETRIKREGEEGSMPAGALFDFTVVPDKLDTDVNVLGIVSIVLVFIFPLAGLITSIIGLTIANRKKQNRNLILTALIINAFLVFIQFAVLAGFFALFAGEAGWDKFLTAPHIKWI